MIELLIATKNQGKLKEIEKLFTDSPIEVKLYFLPDFKITADCRETGKTFIRNAAIKSLFYGKMVPEVYTVGDDSGLEVEALGGEPGVYSARYSGPGSTDDLNTAKLLEKLGNAYNRKAKFVTAVCLSKNGRIIKTFSGEVGGIITDRKKGTHGFGYDPVFYCPPLKKTFAQLPTEVKNRISHRAKAFFKLKEYLESLEEESD